MKSDSEHCAAFFFPHSVLECLNTCSLGVVELLGLGACQELPSGELLHRNLADLVSLGFQR